jgi:uncharacterized phage-associated protein
MSVMNTFNEEVSPGIPALDQKSTSVFLSLLDSAADKGITMTRTKLVKLLYLLDLQRVANRLQPATSIEWRWRHYGPYANSIYHTESELCRVGLIESIPRQWGANNGRELRLLKSEYVSPESDIIASIDAVIKEFGHMTPTQIKDHTYTTAPMLAAQKNGDREVLLDMKLARPKINVRRVASRYSRRRAETQKEAFDNAGAQPELLQMISDTSLTRRRANKLLEA